MAGLLLTLHIPAHLSDRQTMNPIELIEKLITERGSAAVLREHLGLLKAQQAALETRCRDVEAKNAQLERDLAQHKARADQAEQALRDSAAGAPCCDHCAGVSLQRTGTRPHPVMGAVGLKEAVYVCRTCGRTSYFELPLP